MVGYRGVGGEMYVWIQMGGWRDVCLDTDGWVERCMFGYRWVGGWRDVSLNIDGWMCGEMYVLI